ncbi:hypothetical protein [Tepidiforma sp.]|uniref:hypothetical protein n=1 Tax=Tepidiforma sp. TaxID=2682230 RepID=UPI0026284820|nr:hypothetical protein [Tepidiforma sp.]MCX7616675.1 DUF4352 domain-containing protein [Tepidiforma sp.]
MRWSRALLILAGGVLLFLAGILTFAEREGERVGVTTPPAADAGNPRAPLGESAAPAASPVAGRAAEVDGVRYTIIDIADPEPPGVFPVKAGHRRVGILLELEGLQPRASYNFSLLRLRGSDGQLYTWALSNQEPALRMGVLEPGQAVEGWIAYDLPPAVRPAALEYGRGVSAVPLLTLE